ncbi:hypothetical protein THAOC_36314 [Thalassiosira oceanica]|uniref:Uncharacterized protein n=1 Tax=Thalassiosira oceanica TaxID=159749 RepID=K0R217_THAOC|nr:hypothetical protein THAOC_36314 [Thalassiosira oceanica]|eukprot:EJK45089.1 hypothetical protein THAOC_36314 [Thalassiosira oceanica]
MTPNSDTRPDAAPWTSSESRRRCTSRGRRDSSARADATAEPSASPAGPVPSFSGRSAGAPPPSSPSPNSLLGAAFSPLSPPPPPGRPGRPGRGAPRPAPPAPRPSPSLPSPRPSSRRARGTGWQGRVGARYASRRPATGPTGGASASRRWCSSLRRLRGVRRAVRPAGAAGDRSAAWERPREGGRTEGRPGAAARRAADCTPFEGSRPAYSLLASPRPPREYPPRKRPTAAAIPMRRGTGAPKEDRRLPQAEPLPILPSPLWQDSQWQDRKSFLRASATYALLSSPPFLRSFVVSEGLHRKPAARMTACRN